MCQYSSVDGFSNDWHFVHLGTRAVGGAALVMTEATAVTADGRISPQDLGIYDDRHVEGLAQLRALHPRAEDARRHAARARRAQGQHGAPVGRRRRRRAPADGGWEPVGPTAEPFAANYPTPRALTPDDIAAIVDAFSDRRAPRARGRLRRRRAARGARLPDSRVSLAAREHARPTRTAARSTTGSASCLEIVDAVRGVWPERLPLFVRISATDWKEGGWDLEQAVELARRLRAHGVDLVDCSSGGAVHDQQIAVGPGYQVPFAERIRRDAGVPTGAVGLITKAEQADAIISHGQADVVLLARELLRDPYWPLHAAEQLGQRVPWPPQYLRAAHRDTPAR